MAGVVIGNLNITNTPTDPPTLTNTPTNTPTLTQTLTSTPTYTPTAPRCILEEFIVVPVSGEVAIGTYPVGTLLSLYGRGNCPGGQVRASKFSINGEGFGEDAGVREQAETWTVIEGETEICFDITYGDWAVSPPDNCVTVIGVADAQNTATPTDVTSSPTPTNTSIPTTSPTPDLPPVLILFPETESFIIHVASPAAISLAGLELTVLIDNESRTVKPMDDFDVLILLDGMAQPGACFRYLAPDATVALPSECANRQLLFDRRLARSDVFWSDARTGEIQNVAVQVAGMPLLFNAIPVVCAAERCEIYQLENQ